MPNQPRFSNRRPPDPRLISSSVLLMTSSEKHRWSLILAFGLVYAFWGSTYLGIAIAVVLALGRARRAEGTAVRSLRLTRLAGRGVRGLQEA